MIPLCAIGSATDLKTGKHLNGTNIHMFFNMNLVLLLTCVLPLATSACAQIFLRLDGISGSSTFVGHENEIDITSFDFSVDHHPPSAGTNGILSGGTNGTGKATFSPIVITKSLDVASPLLFNHTATGEVIPFGNLTAVRFGEEMRSPIERVDLSNVVVINYTQKASIEQGPLQITEVISLAYSRISMRVAGNNGAFVIACFDVVSNVPC